MFELELFDLYEKKINADSTKAACQELGYSNGSIVVKVRNGTHHFTDEKIIKMATECGIEPSEALVKAHVERAKTKSERDTWMNVQKKIVGMFAPIILTSIPLIPNFRECILC